MNKISILLVEDYPDTCALLQMFLENAGFFVTPAGDGAEALELLGQNKPDLVVTDLMMPRVSGVELIQYIRANKELSVIPVIAMTAYSSGPVKQAREAGANCVLRKPLDAEVLTSTVRELVE
ncbi:MAG TPA: response regulator [Blastocatellia bacterium]|nr:response regulator [Blastocatellia bacterium]